MNDTVLLVDDDDDFRDTVCEILREEGFEVMLSASASQAIEHASRQTPSICLLDVALPKIDGIQLLRYFRSRRLFRQMPVILLTAGIRKNEARQALQLGVKDVLLKSRFSIQQMMDRIHRRIHEESQSSGDSSAEWDSDPSIHSGSPENLPSGFDSSLDFEFPIDPPKGDPSAWQHTQCILSEEMIDAIGGMRSLPAILEKIVASLSQIEPDLLELEQILHRDPSVKSLLLQSAKDATLQGVEPARDLSSALHLLGPSHLLHLIATRAILRPDDLEGDAGEDLIALWRAGLATGLIAEHLATPPNSSKAFLYGLLTELPSIFALQYLGSDWLKWKSHGLVKSWPLREVLSSALGGPLEAMARQILVAYRTPPPIALPIQEFHDSILAARSTEPSTLAKLGDFARMLACIYGRFGTAFTEIRALHREEWKLHGLAQGTLPDLIGAILNLESLASLPKNDMELPQTNCKVLFWRDPRWSDPDPIESILRRSTDCLRVERFEELAASGRVRVAVAEPGSLEWERLGNVAPVIALHRGTRRPGPLPPGVDPLRMPLPIHQLLHKIRKSIP